jgi:apolipoprotein N-acyltransferase
MKCGWCSDGVAVDGVGVVVYRRLAVLGYWAAAAAVLAGHWWIGVGVGSGGRMLLLLLLLYTKVDAGLPFHCGGYC